MTKKTDKLTARSKREDEAAFQQQFDTLQPDSPGDVDVAARAVAAAQAAGAPVNPGENAAPADGTPGQDDSFERDFRDQNKDGKKT